MNRLRAAGLWVSLALQFESAAVASTVDLVGPLGSAYFGGTVVTLPNGNFDS